MFDLTKLDISKIKYRFFVTVHLDKEQVRVSRIGEHEFRIKCGKVLTDREIKGAIIKYLIKNDENI